MQAIAFPLAVDKYAGLYARTVTEGGNRYRLEVPAGEHTLLVRFVPRAPRKDNAEVGLREWKAVITVLPLGALAAGPLRMEEA